MPYLILRSMDKRKYNRGTLGNKGGRKPNSERLKLIETLDTHIDHNEVIKVLKSLCLEGNLKAIQIYLAYRVGKPIEQKEEDGEEREPIQVTIVTPEDIERFN